MTFLATLNRMAPTAVKRAATASIKPSAVALSQKRFNSTSGTKMTVREALNQALEEEMNKDETVYIMGEEVAQYNGAYKQRACRGGRENLEWDNPGKTKKDW
ncbi:pyruvate dehydrogenase E1, beta subunit, partial [Rhizopus stolonifer]